MKYSFNPKIINIDLNSLNYSLKMNIGPINNNSITPADQIIPGLIDIPYNNIYMNVDSIVLFKELNTYPRWLIIICGISSSHPNYKNLSKTIDDITYPTKIGKRTKINLGETFDFSKLLNKSYSIDLRQYPDEEIKNLITLDLPKESPDWYSSIYYDKIYNKTKGLVIYVDKMDDIPNTIYARSTIGLCNLSEKDLSNFLFKGCAKRLNNINPLNSDNSIVGYVNAHTWTKLVKL